MRTIDNNNNSVEESVQDQPQAEVDSSVQVQDESQATQTDQGQSEDSFFDPNSVPEELKPAYKQMQAAFTKKTQEAAQARKESEAIRQDAEAYKRYEQYIPIVEEMLANQKAQQSPEMAALEQRLRAQGYNDDAIEMMKMGVQFTLTQFNQQQEIQRISQGINEAGKLDPRLNDASLVYTLDDGSTATFGQIVEELVAADPAWQRDPIAATQRALKKVDALLGKAKLDGKEELSASAKTKAEKFPQSNSSPQSAANASQAKTIQDAFKEAKQELGV